MMCDLLEGVLSEFAEASHIGHATWLDWFGGIKDAMHISRERYSTGAKSPKATKAWKNRNRVQVAADHDDWQRRNREKVAAYSRAYRAREKERRLGIALQ
jgi:hypothetical protein